MKLLTVPVWHPDQWVIPVTEPSTVACDCPRTTIGGGASWYEHSHSCPIYTNKEHPHGTNNAPFRGRIGIATPCPSCNGDGRDIDTYVGVCTCETCDGLGHLIVASAVVDDCVPIVAITDDMPEPFVPHVAAGRFAPAYYVSAPTESVPFIARLTPSEYALILSDVQPTIERCPACWGTGHVPTAKPCDGSFYHCSACGINDQVGTGKRQPIPVAASGEWGQWP